jgi:hypothetical protein
MTTVLIAPSANSFVPVYPGAPATAGHPPALVPRQGPLAQQLHAHDPAHLTYPVRHCAGGRPQGRSLPRPTLSKGYDLDYMRPQGGPGSPVALGGPGQTCLPACGSISPGAWATAGMPRSTSVFPPCRVAVRLRPPGPRPASPGRTSAAETLSPLTRRVTSQRSGQPWLESSVSKAGVLRCGSSGLYLDCRNHPIGRGEAAPRADDFAPFAACCRQRLASQVPCVRQTWWSPRSTGLFPPPSSTRRRAHPQEPRPDRRRHDRPGATALHAEMARTTWQRGPRSPGNPCH